jgi:hypothetical protein
VSISTARHHCSVSYVFAQTGTIRTEGALRSGNGTSWLAITGGTRRYGAVWGEVRVVRTDARTTRLIFYVEIP